MRPRRPSSLSSRAGRGAGGKRPPPSLKARAIALLARRDYSRAELRQKLLRFGGHARDWDLGVDAGMGENARDDAFETQAQAVSTRDANGFASAAEPKASSECQPASSAEQLEAVLDELAQLGYLSDERYARSMAARKSATHSRRAIVEELKARGVAGEAAQSAVDASEADDAATMRALWQRRFGAAPRDDRDKARQVRFLQSRGFALSAILRFLRELPSDEDTPAA